jgi:hypothetical protein
MGALCEQSKTVQTLLNDPNVTEEQILTFVDRYIHGVETKDMTDLNWSAYRTSKALLNAWARFHLPYLFNNLAIIWKRGKRRSLCILENAKHRWQIGKLA